MGSGGKHARVAREAGAEGAKDANKARLVAAEALAMIACMRQNARFCADNGDNPRPRADSDGGEHPLIHGLNRIRQQPGPSAAASSSRERIAPFVDLITSPETPGMITGAALTSVGRLLQGGVVEKAADLAFLVEGVLACKFEQSDPGALVLCNASSMRQLSQRVLAPCPVEPAAAVGAT